MTLPPSIVEEMAREIFELTRYDSNPEAVEAAFASALRQAYAQGVEEAARVADARATRLRDEGEKTDYPPAWEDREMEALCGARDIRALLPKDDVGKG